MFFALNFPSCKFFGHAIVDEEILGSPVEIHEISPNKFGMFSILTTLPETDKASENQWLEDDMSF